MAEVVNIQSNKFGLIPIVRQENGKILHSLQHLCRTSILSSLTLDRIQSVGKLPLPNLLKDFLRLVNIPADFDLEEFYIDYHCNFPNHVHHKVHQIHPGKCLIDGSHVLVKSQHLGINCSTCESAGKCVMKSDGERENWLHFNHSNLMKCHVATVDSVEKRICYVFEFPSITLQDFAFRMYLAKKQVPEIITWSVIQKLASVLMYLGMQGVVPWQLCHPQNVILTKQGDIKLENMLLYLPTKPGARFQTNTSKYIPPEVKTGHEDMKTLVWGLGCIIHELTAPHPCSFLKGHIPWFQTQFPPLPGNEGVNYSRELSKIVCDCLNQNPHSRPSLQYLKMKADRQLKWLENNSEVASMRDLMANLDRLPLSGGFLR